MKADGEENGNLQTFVNVGNTQKPLPLGDNVPEIVRPEVKKSLFETNSGGASLPLGTAVIPRCWNKTGRNVVEKFVFL